jgi:hypothetical protein
MCTGIFVRQQLERVNAHSLQRVIGTFFSGPALPRRTEMRVREGSE